MLFTKKQLKFLIENFLNEDDWLGDEEEDDLDFHDYNQEYEEMKEVFSKAKDVVKKEIEQDVTSKKIKAKYAKSLKKMIDKTNLIIVNQIPGNATTAAVALTVAHANHNVYEPDVSDIKDQFIEVGKKYFDAYRQNPFKNPAIIYLSKNNHPFKLGTGKVYSDKEINDFILHELDHVKYAFLQYALKNFEKSDVILNEKEVRKILRKDMKGISLSKAASLIVNEKYVKDKNNAEDLLRSIFKHYQAVLSPPVTQNIFVEEFATRIKVLLREPDVGAILKAYRSGNLNARSVQEKYGIQIAQVLPYIDKKSKLEDLKKIVLRKPKTKAKSSFG